MAITSGDAELPAEYGLILPGPQDGAEKAQRLFVYLWHNLCLVSNLVL